MKFIVTTLLLGLSLHSFAANQCDRMTSEFKISAWAFEAMMAIHNYNFVNYKQAQQRAQGYFTKAAWGIYKKAYEESKIQDKVIAKQLVLSTGLYQSPLFLGQGDKEWHIQMPLLLISQTPSVYSEDKQLVELTIIKDSSAADCLKISKMESKQLPEKKT